MFFSFQRVFVFPLVSPILRRMSKGIDAQWFRKFIYDKSQPLKNVANLRLFHIKCIWNE